MDSARTAEAKRIIENYLQTLSSVTELLAFGVPESLLAHQRDEIRQAVRDWLAGGTMSPDFQADTLRAAYQSLAAFLPYDEAHAAARLHHAFERGDYAYLASPDAERAISRSRRIEHEAGELAREFDALANAPADPVLAEVDAFLSAFDRRQTPSTA